MTTISPFDWRNFTRKTTAAESEKQPEGRGGSTTPVDPARKAQLVADMKAAKDTTVALAHKYGIAPSTVRRIRQRAGLVIPNMRAEQGLTYLAVLAKANKSLDQVTIRHTASIKLNPQRASRILLFLADNGYATRSFEKPYRYTITHKGGQFLKTSQKA